MLQELRFRICTAHPDTPMMLHEGKLAQEFGVSRTPIRQVLQRLSFEHLLETRSGVGTVVSTLDPTRRDLHFLMLSDILRLCTHCCAPSLSVSARVQIATTAELIANPAGPPVESYFAVRAQLLDLASNLVEDPIVAEAHAALHWRGIRWRMQSAYRNVASAFPALNATVAAVSAAGTPTDILQILAMETP
ncbi:MULTISPECIES: GntR family transcriptional regulator [unclassified Rhizobium]|uniref:GntR family transcriptional regulator n=1 Tax=unclassified Rhizobium TaxID=2613769 RepID=UPI00381C7F58